MKSKAWLVSIILCGFLSSCEGSLRFIGHVYDRQTSKLLENVHVTWRFNNGVLLENIQLVYDTIPEKKRLQLRKSGIEDDYTYSCCPLDDSLYWNRFNVLTHGNPPDMVSWPPSKKSQYKGPYFEYAGKDSLRRFAACFTNDRGVFLSGPMLVGMVFGPPKVELIFSKSGYKTTAFRPTGNLSDSIVVNMERE